MKLLVFGGTFNPVHIGHLHLADEIYHSGNFDQIVLVPTSIPVHKPAINDISPEVRLEMLELAVQSIPYLSVDDCEIQRGGSSYSIDTIRHMIRKYDLDEKPGLLIGDDLLPGLPAWRNYPDLIEQAEIIVAKRGSGAIQPHSFKQFENMRLPVSSSDIRRRIAKNEAFRFLVPESVYSYIIENRIYGFEDKIE